jgi:hypothetical protein
VRSMPQRTWTVATTTKANAVHDKIRTECMSATLDMMSALVAISGKKTFPSIYRGMIMVASSVPLKIMCLGIGPYEYGILPPWPRS